MTKTTRRRIDAGLKAKIALEALREQATVTDLPPGPSQPDLRLEEAASGSGGAGVRSPGLGGTRKPRMSGRSSGCTPRSGSSRWSGIFWPGGPEDERAGPQSDARPGRRGAVGSAAMRASGRGALGRLSPWTDAAAGWTTSSSNGCGGRSSTRTSISRATPTAAKPRAVSPLGSPSTTSSDRTKRSPTAPMAVWREAIAGAGAVDMTDNASALPTCPQQQNQTQSLAA